MFIHFFSKWNKNRVIHTSLNLTLPFILYSYNSQNTHTHIERATTYIPLVSSRAKWKYIYIYMLLKVKCKRVTHCICYFTSCDTYNNNNKTTKTAAVTTEKNSLDTMKIIILLFLRNRWLYFMYKYGQIFMNEWMNQNDILVYHFLLSKLIVKLIYCFTEVK